MTTNIRIVEEPEKQLSMHPKKFALWLFIVSVVMLFGAWTSAYIVKRGEPGWSSFALPGQFAINTAIIILSSASMIWAHRSVKRDELKVAKLALWVTMALGIAFLAGQWQAWSKMVAMNYYFTGMGSNTSSTFIYLLTGAHGLHIISGLIVLAVTLNSVYRYKIHSKNMTPIQMCSTYWHFLGVLWLYLFVFLSLYR